jgi:hypothetical protein
VEIVAVAAAAAYLLQSRESETTVLVEETVPGHDGGIPTVSGSPAPPYDERPANLRPETVTVDLPANLLPDLPTVRLPGLPHVDLPSVDIDLPLPDVELPNFGDVSGPVVGDLIEDASSLVAVLPLVRYELFLLTGRDPFDAFKGLFGQSDLDKIRRMERKAGRELAAGQAAIARVVFKWITDNQAVSIRTISELYERGGYRDFIDLLRGWNRFTGGNVPWMSPAMESAWTEIDNPDAAARVPAIMQLIQAGLTVIQ